MQNSLNLSDIELENKLVEAINKKKEYLLLDLYAVFNEDTTFSNLFLTLEKLRKQRRIQVQYSKNKDYPIRFYQKLGYEPETLDR